MQSDDNYTTQRRVKKHDMQIEIGIQTYLFIHLKSEDIFNFTFVDVAECVRLLF